MNIIVKYLKNNLLILFYFSFFMIYLTWFTTNNYFILLNILALYFIIFYNLFDINNVIPKDKIYLKFNILNFIKSFIILFIIISQRFTKYSYLEFFLLFFMLTIIEAIQYFLNKKNINNIAKTIVYTHYLYLFIFIIFMIYYFFILVFSKHIIYIDSNINTVFYVLFLPLFMVILYYNDININRLNDINKIINKNQNILSVSKRTENNITKEQKTPQENDNENNDINALEFNLKKHEQMDDEEKNDFSFTKFEVI